MNKFTGIIWAFFAVGLFGLIYIVGKLDNIHANPSQIILCRYFGALLTVSAIIFSSKNKKNYLSTEQILVHVLRALSGGLGGMAAIYAAMNLPVASATSIGLLDGVFTVLLGVFILKEKFRVFQWLAAIICLVGSLIVSLSHGGIESFTTIKSFPALVALVGACLVAIESILIKMLARSQNALTVIFYVSLFGSFIFTVISLLNWQSVHILEILLLLLLGPLAVLAQFLNILAFRLCDAAVIGSVRYTWIIWGTFFGYLFFNEAPTFSNYVGCLFILLGGSLLTLGNKKIKNLN